jgi:sugar phosphate isomerase/epimerase
MNLAIQSFCFREFTDNRAVARMVRELGLSRIEVCAVHADFNDLERWREIVGIYREEGVEIVSIGVQTFTGEAVEERWFECAAAAGASHLSAHFQVDTFPRAIAKVRSWSRHYGVRVGIHNHGGYMFGGQPDVLRTLLALGTPEVGLCLDTAWCLQIGPRPGQPVEWVEAFASNLTAVHLKDFRFDRNGQWHDTLIGEGNLDLPAFLAALRKVGFAGLPIIEYEADPSNPMPALKECVSRVRAVLAS